MPKRLAESINEIWYVQTLANNDITRYKEVRKSNLVDALKTIETLLMRS